MISENLVKKAIRVVFLRLRKILRGAGWEGEELRNAKDRLCSLAGWGVERAIKEYNSDRTNAVFLWLKIAGMQRALDALREEDYRRVGKGRVWISKGDPAKPFRHTDLAINERKQFENGIACDGEKPYPLELFDHPCLSDEERAVLIARFVESRTWKETAAALGAKVGVCRRREESAKRKLKRVIGKEI